ncbi:hypothetical protein BJ993_004726 [Nocardioides aromaticivorans]|uniref:Uncharacterized protein n=1 Tax=Nocardioides aromaticivorans TaxID=200618 RepID=A0A7Y9ZMM1_9ACTN|nr:AAA family ATPase [Nocardioides aromaticivorans]NYI47646.1 hypothetical protein [Nocardioides aromaticivorans]
MTQFDPYAKPLPISEPDPQSLQQLIFGNEEEEAYRKVRARKRAEERYAEEHREHFAGVAGRSLRDLHLCPPPDIEWTIEKLAARGSIVFALGTFKSGKSSLVVNLLRSLADGAAFLGTYPVRQVNGKIGYFDFEMGIAETYDRLRRIGCANDEKVLVYDLVAAGFDLMADSSYEWIRSEINAAGLEIIVLDALRHIAKKKDGNNDSEIQAIFTRLERLRKDCSSLEDIFIPAHTAKGDSARPGDDISVLGSAAWDGGAQYRWGSYRTRTKEGWRYSFCLLPSRRTDPEAARPRDLSMDENGVLSLGAAGDAVANERKRTQEARRSSITAFVSANEPTSKNKIHAAVGGGRVETLALISSMHGNDLWIDESERTPKVWTFQSFVNKPRGATGL